MQRISIDSPKSIRLKGTYVPGAEDRQKKIPGFDQEIFSKASVLCIGAGGLISHARRSSRTRSLVTHDRRQVPRPRSDYLGLTPGSHLFHPQALAHAAFHEGDIAAVRRDGRVRGPAIFRDFGNLHRQRIDHRLGHGQMVVEKKAEPDDDAGHKSERKLKHSF